MDATSQDPEVLGRELVFTGTRVPVKSRMKIELLDTVALVLDVPELGLASGEAGAVVEVLSDDTFEVEFVDNDGRTYGLHALRADQLVALHTKGHALR